MTTVLDEKPPIQAAFFIPIFNCTEREGVNLTFCWELYVPLNDELARKSGLRGS
jgi:hypothetical protein